jgi:hypothetical protein
LIKESRSLSVVELGCMGEVEEDGRRKNEEVGRDLI